MKKAQAQIKKKTTANPKPVKHEKDYAETLALKTTKDTIAIIKQWVEKYSVVGIIDYTNWFIGVSDKEVTTKGLNHLLSRYAESKHISLAIEKYFHDKGMGIEDFKGSLSEKSAYVYIHKIHKGLLE